MIRYGRSNNLSELTHIEFLELSGLKALDLWTQRLDGYDDEADLVYIHTLGSFLSANALGLQVYIFPPTLFPRLINQIRY